MRWRHEACRDHRAAAGLQRPRTASRSQRCDLWRTIESLVNEFCLRLMVCRFGPESAYGDPQPRRAGAQSDNRDVWILKFHCGASDAPEHSKIFSSCQPAMARVCELAISFHNSDVATGFACEIRQINIELARGIVDASCSMILFRPATDIFIQCRYQTHLRFS